MSQDTWGRVMAGLWAHPKWLRLSPAARGLWISAFSWCIDRGPDGVVPAYILPTLGGDAALAEELTTVILWDPHPDGYRFHDWDEHQEQLPARRRALRKAAARKAAAARWKDHTPVDNRVNSSQKPVVDKCDDDAIGMRSACDDDTDSMRTGCDTNAIASENPRNHAANECDSDAAPMRTVCDPMPREREEELYNPPTPLEGGGADEDLDGFNEWWDLYPRKSNRPAAARAYRAARRRGLTRTGLLAAVAAYRDDPNLPPPRYIPAPAKWLRAEAWNDLPLPARDDTTTTTRASPAQEPPRDLHQRETAALQGIDPNDTVAYLHAIRAARRGTPNPHTKETTPWPTQRPRSSAI